MSRTPRLAHREWLESRFDFHPLDWDWVVVGLMGLMLLFLVILFRRRGWH